MNKTFYLNDFQIKALLFQDFSKNLTFFINTLTMHTKKLLLVWVLLVYMDPYVVYDTINIFQTQTGGNRNNCIFTNSTEKQ